MYQRYLDVTYRKGKPLAAYFHLPRKPGDFSARTERSHSGLVIDFAEDGRAIGIEITSPTKVTLAALGEALAAVNQEPATADEIAPLLSVQHQLSVAQH